MEYTNDYEGHRITVWTTKLDQGWTWCYAVDDRPIERRHAGQASHESLVLNEGITQCRRAIRRAV